jgi:hypothetical protein
MNFYTAKQLPARSLATTGTGEPARQAASSGLPGCVPGWAFLRLPACGDARRSDVPTGTRAARMRRALRRNAAGEKKKKEAGATPNLLNQQSINVNFAVCDSFALQQNPILRIT